MSQSPGKPPATNRVRTKTAPPKAVEASKKPVAGKKLASSTTAPKTTPAKTASAKQATKTPVKKASPRMAAQKGDGEADSPQSSTPSSRTIGGVTPEQRYRMICDAAYFRAERRGFVGGNALQDWVDAEAEIDGLLREMQQ